MEGVIPNIFCRFGLILCTRFQWAGFFKGPHAQNEEKSQSKEGFEPDSRQFVNISVAVRTKPDAHKDENPDEWRHGFFAKKNRRKERHIGAENDVGNRFRAGVENHEVSGGEGRHKERRDDGGVDFFQLPSQTERDKSEDCTHGEPLFIRQVEAECSKHAGDVVVVIARRNTGNGDLFDTHLPLVQNIVRIVVNE